MARQRRWVAVGLPHHITQRGNGRRDIFLDDRLKQIYLNVLADEARRFQLRILGYCIMTNHVHLIAIPETELAMAFTLRRAHGKFAQYWNTQVGTVGHMWQNRYFSCPVEPARVWSVLRYVEQNPVRAGMVPHATDYAWSSAAPHTQGMGAHRILDMSWWSREWTSGDWVTALNAPWQTG